MMFTLTAWENRLSASDTTCNPRISLRDFDLGGVMKRDDSIAWLQNYLRVSAQDGGCVLVEDSWASIADQSRVLSTGCLYTAGSRPVCGFDLEPQNARLREALSFPIGFAFTGLILRGPLQSCCIATGSPPDIAVQEVLGGLQSVFVAAYALEGFVVAEC